MLARFSCLLVGACALGCAANRPGAGGPDGSDPDVAGENRPPLTPLVFHAAGAPSDSATRFGGAEDPARAPTIVYPLDGVVVPPNLRELAFHFLPGSGNTLFELRFRSPSLDVTVYLPCAPLGAGCAFSPDDAVWEAIAGAGRDGASITIVLRSTDGTSPSPIGVSPGQTLRFTREDILGGLYYWAASAGGIYRYDFGRRGQRAEAFYTPAMAGGGFCIGCHALSRNGARIAVGLDIPAPAQLRVLDVATRGPQWSGTANFMAFSPDASLLVTSDGNTLVLRDGATGAVIQDPLDASGTMPDFAPDGRGIVFARPGSSFPCPIPGFCGNPGVDRGSLQVMRRSASGWDPPALLVNFDGLNNYYPSFSPDGGWVVFNRSIGNSFDATDASVWITSNDGRIAPIELRRGTAGAASSWPKNAPFAQTLEGEPVFWVAFSSRRAYGLTLADGQIAQIWIAAVAPSRVARGEDPSFAAFWLPFQDITTGNHIPQWVETVERQSCSVDTQCGMGEFCETGSCVPDIR